MLFKPYTMKGMDWNFLRETRQLNICKTFLTISWGYFSALISTNEQDRQRVVNILRRGEKAF